MTRRGTASIVASPVLVGAVTTLIVIVAVFLAYNANQGLPFVPTYNISAELPSGAKLVKGNEVRIGGFRVGIVDQIRAGTQGGRAIAVIDMKLDKVVEELPIDSRVYVRPRSALGLKYVELTVGRSKKTFPPGDRVPITNARDPLELEDFLSTFDEEMRQNSRTSLEGYGDALAGRGQSLNMAIESLPEFFLNLEPVMRNLSDPRTGLRNFFRNIGAVSKQVAPVADVQARLFTNMADTFEAFSRNPDALRATIEKAAPTMETAIRSFRVQRPFLVDFADLSRRLRPAVQELPRSLPRINAALLAGQRILPRTVELNLRTADVFRALDELARDPNTLAGIRELRTLVGVTAPLLSFVAPYQTVCNDLVYFLTPLGEHISDPVREGTTERILSRASTSGGRQDDRVNDYPAERPADIPRNEDPRTAKDRVTGQPLTRAMTQPFMPAIDARGNADCQFGQMGYIDGPLSTGNRYPPVSDGNTNNQNDAAFDDKNGGSRVVSDSNTPGLAGGTGGFGRARELSPFKGIGHLDEVDRSLRGR